MIWSQVSSKWDNIKQNDLLYQTWFLSKTLQHRIFRPTFLHSNMRHCSLAIWQHVLHGRNSRNKYNLCHHVMITPMGKSWTPPTSHIDPLHSDSVTLLQCCWWWWWWWWWLWLLIAIVSTPCDDNYFCHRSRENFPNVTHWSAFPWHTDTALSQRP